MRDVLANKLLIFKYHCSKVGLCEDQCHNALSIMLKGRANLYYYQNLTNNNFTFDEMISRLKYQFETEQNKHEYLSIWRDMTLQYLIDKNLNKKVSECFQKLLDKLQVLHEALVGCYNIQASLKDQTLNTCKGIKEFELALFNPAKTFDGVNSQLRSAIYTREQQVPGSQFITDQNNHSNRLDDELDIEQYYLNRRYKGGNRL